MTPLETQAPGKAPNLMRCYSGSSQKEVTLSLSPEEHQRAFRRMRQVERGPFFFDQVTDLTTGKKFDLYREHCGAGCWCAARAKPAKVLLMKVTWMGTKYLQFRTQDGSKEFCAQPDDLTSMMMRDKTLGSDLYCFVKVVRKAYEILSSAPAQDW